MKILRQGLVFAFYEKTWKKAGIFEAIKASTYHIMKDNKLIIELAEKWCCETNTFVFSWGECTITLEDVMILGGFSVLGNSARSQFRVDEGVDVQKMLVEARRKIQKKSKLSYVTLEQWMKYFNGRGGELEHVALIVVWLSRYVFTTCSYTMVNPNVFSIAISLSRGIRIALAPAMLALIYRDLRWLKEEIVDCMSEARNGGSKLVVWAPFQLVQVWAWERFPTLGPEPCCLAAYGEPRVARWHEVRKSKGRNSCRLEIESLGGEFLWRPYALMLENWDFPKFYCDQEKWVLVDCEDEEVLSFAKCLMTCELVGVGCVERYLPQRVALQFALDQDAPFSVPSTSNVGWNSYDKPLDGLKLYIPPRLTKGDVSLRYYKWWVTPLSIASDDEHMYRGDGLDSLGNDIEMPNENSSHSEATDEHGEEDTAMNEQMGADQCKERNANFNEEDKSQEQGTHSVGGEDDMQIEISASLYHEFVIANETVVVALTNSPPGFEEVGINRRGSDLARDVEIAVNEGCTNMNVETSTQDQQGEGRRDDNGESKQVGTPMVDLVNIIDDDDVDIIEAFKAQCDALEARISRLERRKDALSAKMKSKAT